jgi:hypothetical protein
MLVFYAVAAFFALAFVFPASSQSAILQFDMQGTVLANSIPVIAGLSDPFDVFLSYDPEQQPFSITKLYGNVIAEYSAFSFFVVVHDQINGDQIFLPESNATLSMNLFGDLFSLAVGDDLGTSVDLVDDSRTAFTSVELPSSLSLSEFNRTFVGLVHGSILDSTHDGLATGQIQSISLVTPEPNTVIFCCGGLFFWVFLAQLRQARRRAVDKPEASLLRY